MRGAEQGARGWRGDGERGRGRRRAGGTGMPLPFGVLRTDAGREPPAFCLHHSVFRSTASALGAVAEGCQGLPRGL